jgi:hypothetical protein
VDERHEMASRIIRRVLAGEVPSDVIDRVASDILMQLDRANLLLGDEWLRKLDAVREQRNTSDAEAWHLQGLLRPDEIEDEVRHEHSDMT